MENTLENKAKFFAQYLGQKVFWHPEYESEISILKPIMLDTTYHYIGDGYCLKLKPLSSITDEVAKKLGYSNSDVFKTEANEKFCKDELRLLGYAVEWNGVSVEDLLRLCWIKLKK